MSYLGDAFGGFEPHRDLDAAVKLSMNEILLERRFKDLGCVLTDGQAIGGMSGEPGWTIERRNKGASGDIPYFADWPEGARFKASVEPESYELAYPEFFMDEATFLRYVAAGIQAYLKKNPGDFDSVREIVERVKV